MEINNYFNKIILIKIRFNKIIIIKFHNPLKIQFKFYKIIIKIK